MISAYISSFRIMMGHSDTQKRSEPRNGLFNRRFQANNLVSSVQCLVSSQISLTRMSLNDYSRWFSSFYTCENYLLDHTDGRLLVVDYTRLDKELISSEDLFLDVGAKKEHELIESLGDFKKKVRVLTIRTVQSRSQHYSPPITTENIGICCQSNHCRYPL